jgi:hypothetical protein
MFIDAQKKIDQLLRREAERRGISVEQVLEEQEGKKPLFLQAAERLAAKRGVSVEEVLDPMELPDNDNYLDGLLLKADHDYGAGKALKALNETLDHFNITGDENRRVMGEFLLRLTLVKKVKLDLNDDGNQVVHQMQQHFKRLIENNPE